MRRGLLALLTALLVLGSVAQAQSTEIVGALTAMDTASRTLTVRVADRERRVRWNPQTLFVIRGRPGAASDLRPGQRLRVQLQVSGAGRVRDVARRVVVLPAD